jgi:hypothetical protein
MDKPKNVAAGVDLLLSRQMALDDLEEMLRAVKADINELETQHLPELFRDAGLSEMRAADGTKLKMSTLVVGSLPKDPAAKEAAIAKLLEYGLEDLIQTKLTASFGRGDREAAVAAMERLAEGSGNNIGLEDSVNPATLCKVMRERMEAGEPVALTVLGLQPLTRVRITGKKKEG